MNLLLDTQMLVWMVADRRRLPASLVTALQDPATVLLVSAVTAWEYADLLHRGRLPVQETVPEIQSRFRFEIVDLPGECWRLASQLPHIHGDPIDRMAVAHAILGGYVLVTADANMRRYPVTLL
ncbi:MAG TPA: type II toxin-antitoxin system VapC family toxin [Croceibacterium sp.]